MSGSIFLFIVLAVGFVILVSLLVPAGWGLPAPVFGLLALLATGPGLFAGWLLYRRLAARGDVEPLSGAQRGEPEPENPEAPAEGRPVERRVGAFRRAAGNQPDEPL